MSNYTRLTHTELSAIPGAPSPRAAHTCDAVGNFLIVFGGWSGKVALGDAYAYHTKKRRWYGLNLCLDLNPNISSSSKKRPKLTPSSLIRNNHVSSVHNNELYIHAGHDGNQWLSDMYALDVSFLEDSVSGLQFGQLVDIPVRYVDAIGKVPSKRACHSMTRVGDCFYTFGGYDGSQCFNDLEVFDPSISTWSKLSKPHGKKPPARNAHTMVSDGRNLFLIGGHSGSVHFDDVYTYTISSHTWTKVKLDGFIPPPVRGHSTAFYHQEVYMFGGFNGDEPFNTFYVYNLRSCTWGIQDVYYESSSISKRQRCSMVQVGDSLYIFGGFNGKHWLNDLHTIKYQSIQASHSDDSLAALAKNLGQFMNNSRFSDVSISAAGKEIPAHSVILAANSTYFHDLLTKEDPPSVIELNGWSLDAVMKLVEFIYTSKIDDFSSNNHYRICEVLGLADSCNLDKLKSMCEELLVPKIDIDNACYLLKSSKLYNADYLRQCCFDFISENAADVMLTPGFEELSSVPSLVMELAKLSINKTA
ncbi:kelch domain-containing protein [Theileria equi strain WA]|uniref:Kelch domain-containing protein n=1 Tax=Theileria equi strain WA TaxID=1537102 RepID=L0B265_THEEQ|nr:kelch domain-containing protein [Theileria equi strain WA]AFZ81224.1 kelch domain-containing protein [Theileria equi strain WA]|eukprot:XP_004830890.1 kelch domain-containing protein [Theileria equi strain WA]